MLLVLSWAAGPAAALLPSDTLNRYWSDAEQMPGQRHCLGKRMLAMAAACEASNPRRKLHVLTEGLGHCLWEPR